METRRWRIYVASPLTTRGTQLYDMQLARVRVRYPDAEILEPAILFPGFHEWRRDYPTLVTTLDRLVFFADGQGFIGRGTYDDVIRAQTVGVAVEYVDRDGSFLPDSEFDLVPDEEGPWDTYAYLCRRFPEG